MRVATSAACSSEGASTTAKPWIGKLASLSMMPLGDSSTRTPSAFDASPPLTAKRPDLSSFSTRSVIADWSSAGEVASGSIVTVTKNCNCSPPLAFLRAGDEVPVNYFSIRPNVPDFHTYPALWGTRHRRSGLQQFEELFHR